MVNFDSLRGVKGHPQKNLQFFRFVCVFVSLYASFSEDANGVFSTFAGKIKDSGDGLWSPIYGAGEQKRFFEHQ